MMRPLIITPVCPMDLATFSRYRDSGDWVGLETPEGIPATIVINNTGLLLYDANGSNVTNSTDYEQWWAEINSKDWCIDLWTYWGDHGKDIPKSKEVSIHGTIIPSNSKYGNKEADFYALIGRGTDHGLLNFDDFLAFCGEFGIPQYPEIYRYDNLKELVGLDRKASSSVAKWLGYKGKEPILCEKITYLPVDFSDKENVRYLFPPIFVNVLKDLPMSSEKNEKDFLTKMKECVTIKYSLDLIDTWKTIEPIKPMTSTSLNIALVSSIYNKTLHDNPTELNLEDEEVTSVVTSAREKLTAYINKFIEENKLQFVDSGVEWSK